MNPLLYQLNPRTYLTGVSSRVSTLDDIPETFLKQLSSQAVDWLWLLGVWQISPASQVISRSQYFRDELLAALPDLSDADIGGSPFAISGYHTDPALGGDGALARFRERLSGHGIKLMLDFIPNHVGLDHPWHKQHPDYLVAGTPELLQSEPHSWIELPSGAIYAHGRDPNYPGWPDTLQLNYFNPEVHYAMTAELHAIASRADGVRCDMAMLLEPEVFARTWGDTIPHAPPTIPTFWPDAIRSIKKEHPNFLFLAEAYWNYEYTLQQHGFDYTYDKTLYDRVLARNAADVKAHLRAPLSYQTKLARFLENHDEQRIASLLPPAEHCAAATISFMSPGLRLIHEGQIQGKKIRTPVHLSRETREKVDTTIQDLYRLLLPIINSPVSRFGNWHLLDTHQAWPNNPTNENFIAFLIEHPLQTIVTVVNFASYRGQCFVSIPDRTWLTGSIEFRDLLSHERLVRDAADIRERGLFLDCSEWRTHIFSVEQS